MISNICNEMLCPHYFSALFMNNPVFSFREHGRGPVYIKHGARRPSQETSHRRGGGRRTDPDSSSPGIRPVQDETAAQTRHCHVERHVQSRATVTWHSFFRGPVLPDWSILKGWIDVRDCSLSPVLTTNLIRVFKCWISLNDCVVFCSNNFDII